jgi:2-polyprenyl-3-methyl-5-hydroxy-6-metoxy-1,4-benzoquinol methylase
MKCLFSELAEYVNRDLTLVKARCQFASSELAYQWEYYKDDPIKYYRESDLYIFDLTVYQTRLREHAFYEWYANLINNYGWKTGLDYGGGIGEYTIVACQNGVQMDFLEIKDSKTLDYAKWRFKKYGISPVLRYEDFKIEQDYDFIVAMDVFEHMEKPEPVIKAIAEHTEYIFCNPDQIQFNWLYPQHISKFILEPYFENVGLYLWKRK